jgi:Flp pilus assembly protein CpaB
MKSKSLILMVVAMGCGLIAAYTTAKLTAKGVDDTEKVYVATNEIKVGTVIKEPEKLFVEIDYKKGTAPNAMSDLEKMKDKVVTRTVRPGQFLVPDDLSSNFGISPPKGTKGMSIKVTPDSAVAGFIMPGSRVDVMATIIENGNNQKPKVMTVLQNQEVLAVDRISVRPDGQSAVEAINTVTLAVTPQNAQKLELAVRLSGGVVRLLLRDQNDTTITRINTRESLSDSGNEFGAVENSSTVIHALAAREDVKPGTKIDDPEKFFTAVALASVPASSYLESDMAKLKGLTLRVALFKDGVVTAKHFDEKEVSEAAANPTAAGSANIPVIHEPVRHVLFIQNGGKEAQMIVYQDGVVINSEQANNRPIGSSTPLPPAPPKPDNPNPDAKERPTKADRPE